MPRPNLAAKYNWSRSPGKFVNKNTGKELPPNQRPNFSGGTPEWFELLYRVILDLISEYEPCPFCRPTMNVVIHPDLFDLFSRMPSFKYTGKKPCPAAIGSLGRDGDVLVIVDHKLVDKKQVAVFSTLNTVPIGFIDILD